MKEGEEKREGEERERRGKCGKETHEVSVHCPVLVKNAYVHTTTLCTCMETPVIRDNNHTKTHIHNIVDSIHRHVDSIDCD